MRIDPAAFQENERTAPSHDGRSFAEIGSLSLLAGGMLDEVVVAYETWGTLNLDKSNAVFVCHALSGDSHAIGWWSRLIGPGKAIDTDRYYVIGSNCLGGCQGTTGPASTAPDGKPYASRFPAVTVQDMVAAQSKLLEQHGIGRLHCVCGGSMGGMQALEWAIQFPDRVGKVWMTASCAAHSAMQIGFNEAGRQAIMRDPKWRGGDYPADDSPAAGLSVARMVGHLTYLSEASFGHKFGRGLQGKDRLSYDGGVEFQVESYLNYQGDKFTKRFDANSYLVLTRAIDYYEANSLEGAEADFLLTSFDSDWIYPTHQSLKVLHMAQESGLRVRHEEIRSSMGHDAFLLDDGRQAELVSAFLAKE